MVFPNLALRLRDKLGPEASQDLSRAFEEVESDMLTIAAERFDNGCSPSNPICDRT